MRTINVSLTVVVPVQVPDDFPVTDEQIQVIADWKINDYSDGRMPFGTEMLMDGSVRAVSNAVHESVEYYVFNLPSYRHNKRIRERNRVVRKIVSEVLVDSPHGQPVDIRVGYEAEGVNPYEDSFLVACKSSVEEGGDEGYELATRHVFATQHAAQEYCEGISASREAIIIPGRYHQLRLPGEKTNVLLAADEVSAKERNAALGL